MPPTDIPPEQPDPERPVVQGEPTETTEVIDAADIGRAIREAEAAAGIPGLEGFALVVTSGPRQGAHWALDDGEW